MSLKTGLIVVGALVFIGFGGGLMFAMSGGEAKLADAATTGPNPTIPPPEKRLIPTVNIAPAKGWPAGTKPVFV